MRDKIQIAKYSTAGCIFLFVIYMMFFTGGSTKAFEEVAPMIEREISEKEYVRQDGQALKRYYGLNGMEYEGVLYYMSDFSLSAEEILLIKVKSEKQVQSVREAIVKRREERIEVFSGYAPEEVQLLEDSKILVRGKWIFYVVSPVADVYVSAFQKGL